MEVLPESRKLAALIAKIAAKNGYVINIVPAYGSDEIQIIPPSNFTLSLLSQFHSKDIVLSRAAL